MRNALAFGSVKLWPRPKRSCRKPSSFLLTSSPTVTPFANWLSTAQRFSPLVGLEEGAHPESLFCEVTGCTHLWGGEKPFLEAVRDYWRKRGFQIQLALTSTMGASWALAHTSRISLVNAGDEESALSGLSVAALRLPAVVLESLEALGLWTIGDVLRLPRESLASRFGAILPQRLGQALGLISGDLCLRALERAAFGLPRVGGAG